MNAALLISPLCLSPGQSRRAATAARARPRPAHPFAFLLQDVPVEALTTVKPYCNEIHAQAQLWLKRDPKASYEAWKKCLPIRGVSAFRDLRSGPSLPLADGPASPPSVPFSSLPLPAPLCLPGIDGNGKSPSKSELRHLSLTEKYVWRWKQFLSRRGKRTSPLDLKLGHNNWLRQVSYRSPGLLIAALAPGPRQGISAPHRMSPLLSLLSLC